MSIVNVTDREIELSRQHKDEQGHLFAMSQVVDQLKERLFWSSFDHTKRSGLDHHHVYCQALSEDNE